MEHLSDTPLEEKHLAHELGLIEHFALHRTGTFLKPEMGLPVELWLYIITFLASDPLSLNALSLTCRCFRYPAQDMVASLDFRHIDPTSYSSVHELVGDIRDSPELSLCINILILHPGSQATGVTSLSLIPHQLSNKLIKLRELRMQTIVQELTPHPSTWSLLGRTLPHVTTLDLFSVRFSSFKDLSTILTSLSSLSVLRISRISCTTIQIPPVIVRGPKKRCLRLTELTISYFITLSEQLFFDIFTRWFLGSNGQVPGNIEFFTPLASNPPLRNLLVGLREHLQSLEIWCLNLKTPDGEMEYEDIGQQRWMAVFKCQFPQLREIQLRLVSKHDVSLVQALLACNMSQLPDIKLTIATSQGAVDSYTWSTLDILFSAKYTMSRIRYGSRSHLSISFGSLKGNAQSMLPLILSLGRDTWFIMLRR